MNQDQIKSKGTLQRFLLPLGAFTACALWGSAFPAVKHAYNYFDVIDYETRMAFAGIRFVIAGLLLLIIIKSKRAQWKVAPKKMLFGVILLQVFFQYIFFYWGIALIPASLTAILIGTGSFWWLIMASIKDKNERIGLVQFAFLCLGFVGVFIALFSPEKEINYFGVGLILLASICGTSALLIVKPISKFISVRFLTGTSLFTGGLMLCLCAPFRVIEIILESPLELYLLTFYLGFLSAAAFGIWYYLVTIFDVARLSAYRFLIPICGVIESWIFLADESFELKVLLGGTITVFSIYMLEFLKRRETKKL